MKHKETLLGNRISLWCSKQGSIGGITVDNNNAFYLHCVFCWQAWCLLSLSHMELMDALHCTATLVAACRDLKVQLQVEKKKRETFWLDATFHFFQTFGSERWQKRLLAAQRSQQLSMIIFRLEIEKKSSFCSLFFSSFLLNHIPSVALLLVKRRAKLSASNHHFWGFTTLCQP